MKNSSPAWPIFKRKLKERYKNLTDADLREIRVHWKGEQWLDRLHERIGGSRFEIAVLVEEATEAGKGWPVSTPLSLRRNLWA
jgi:hypothetical protein